MSPDTVKAIQQALQPVADKIGQGAQYGWAIVVKQQYIEGVTSLITFALWLVVLTIAGGFLFRGLTKYDWERDAGGKYAVYFIAGGITFVIVFLGIIIADPFTWGLKHLLNPDYYALQFFISLANPVK